jgi:hypothetical protein
MAFTEQQVAQMIMAASNVWEDQGLVPKGLPSPETWSDEQKRQLILRSASIANQNGKFTGFDFDAVMRGLIRDEVIVLDKKNAVVEGLPHQDLFPNIKTIEDAVEYVKKTKIPANLTSQINELLAYLQERKIHRAVATKEQQAANQEPQEILEARSLVANIRPSNFGSSSSAANGGHYAQLVKAKERLIRDIDHNVQRGAKPAAIFQYIREQIDALSNSSVR